MKTYGQDEYIGLDQDALEISSENEDERRLQDVVKTPSSRRMSGGFIFCCIATKRSSFKPKSSSKSKIESQNETLVGCKFQNVKETNLQKF